MARCWRQAGAWLEPVWSRSPSRAESVVQSVCVCLCVSVCLCVCTGQAGRTAICPRRRGVRTATGLLRLSVDTLCEKVTSRRDATRRSPSVTAHAAPPTPARLLPRGHRASSVISHPGFGRPISVQDFPMAGVRWISIAPQIICCWGRFLRTSPVSVDRGLDFTAICRCVAARLAAPGSRVR